MVDVIAQTLLNKYLEPFFCGFSSKNINVEILDGRLTIFNIKLNPQLFQALNFPIVLKQSYVEKLQLIIPWRKQQTTLTLNITNIYGLFTPKADFELYSILMTKKQNLIKKVIKQYQTRMKEKKEKDKTKKNSTVQSMIKKLLDNIEINIGTIHFRYESAKDGYSFGLLIKNAQLSTVDQQYKKTFFNRETNKSNKVIYLLLIQFLGIYFNSNEKNMISEMGFAEMIQKFKNISNLEEGLHYIRQEKKEESLNLIMSISVRTQLNKYIVEKNKDIRIPLFDCKIDFNIIQFKITHHQYNDIIQVVNYFLWYQNLWSQYTSLIQLHPVKTRGSQEISNFLNKKYHRKILLDQKQNQMLKRMTRKLLGWAFKCVFEDQLKRRFIRQAMYKEVTAENLLANKKIRSIMIKIRSEKLEQWVVTAIKMRDQYMKNSTAIIKSMKSSVESYVMKTIARYPLFHHYQEQDDDQDNQVQNEREIVLKLNISIRNFTAEISKEEMFGVALQITDLKIGLSVRRRNFLIDLEMQDFGVQVFSSKNQQRKRTYVSVLQRSLLIQKNRQKLLYIRFQKNPLGQSFVFSQTYIQFKSVEISIYPEAFRQFYEIVFNQSIQQNQSGPNKKGGQKKAAESIRTSELRSIGIQRNKIMGKVSSPWIVFPLSQNNDRKSECWIYRLGDLLIQTPDYDPATFINDQTLYYEHYKLELRNFEIKFFSSIHYFHTWLKFNQNIDRNSSQTHVFDDERYINVIDRTTLYIDLMVLKRFVSNVIRDRKDAFIASISINQLQINVSKFLLNKIHERLYLFGKAGQFDFIQSNVHNLMEDNQMQGFARVTYGKITKLKFFVVLKGVYMYFFLNEKAEKYHFFVDARQHTIKIFSDHTSVHNQGKSKIKTEIVFLYLLDHQKHFQWKKCLNKIISVKDKRINSYEQENNTRKSVEKKSSFSDGLPSIPTVPKSTQKIKNFIVGGRKARRQQHTHENMKNQTKQKSKAFQIPEQITTITKMSLSFKMGKLAIRLIKDEQQFLICKFNQSIFKYKQTTQKQITFSIRQWFIYEPHKDSAFLSSKKFFKEQDLHEGQVSVNNPTMNNQVGNNFLQLQVNFSEISRQMQDINVTVDKLFISWNVDMFNTILHFFFYPEQIDQVPVSTGQKRKMTIYFKIKKLFVYCYQAQNIIALFKLHGCDIKFHQSPIEEYYDFSCQKLEVDKYVGNRMGDSLPMLISKNGESNQLALFYLIRKKNIQGFPNVKKLKNKFGEDLIVAELTCTWADSIIYYQQEQTLRLFNYFLNKILGTVGSKFKKRSFSTKYITQALRIKKLSTFHVLMKNITFLAPPHDRVTNIFQINIKQLLMTKNLSTSYPPRLVIIPTKVENVQVFYETNVIQIKGLILNHKYGSEPSNPITSQPLDMMVSMGKVRFQSQYFPILKSGNDFDRTQEINVTIPTQIKLQLYKISFITFLSIFYQNIKHKDGKAELFEAPAMYTSIRQVKIHIQELYLNLYEEKDHQMIIFSKSRGRNGHIFVRQQGSETDIRVTAQRIYSEMEMPIMPIDEYYQSKNIETEIGIPKFSLQMKSRQGLLEITLVPQNYQISIILDNLNNIFTFIKYDTQFVRNHLMPKKKSSVQVIKVFPKNCQIKLGDIIAQGSFIVSYVKGLDNQIPSEIIDFIGKHEDTIDKEIKVNGERLKGFMRDDPIGQISSIYFHRRSYSSKTSVRQFKKQQVQIGESSLYAQIPDIQNLYEIFKKHIKKNQIEDKSYFQPWNCMPVTPKTQVKRVMEVQINKSSVFLMSTQKNTVFMPHLQVQVFIPKLFYTTLLDEQHVRLRLGLLGKQISKSLAYEGIFYAKQLQIHYTNHKDRHQKTIQIENAKDVKLFMYLIDPVRISKLVYQIKNGALSIPPEKRRNYNDSALLQIANDTEQEAQISIKSYKALDPDFQSKIATIKISPKTKMFIQTSPIDIMQLFHTKTTITINKKETKRLQQLSALRQSQKIYQDYWLNIQSLNDGVLLRLSQDCLIQNLTYIPIQFEKGIKILHGQKKSVCLQTVQKLKFKIYNKEQTLNLNKNYQQICNGYIFVKITKKNKVYITKFGNKYTIENLMPIELRINPSSANQNNITPFTQKQLIYSKNSDKNFTDFYCGDCLMFQISLDKPPQKIVWNHKISIPQKSYTCKIKTKLKHSKSHRVKITLFNQHILNNRSNQTLYIYDKNKTNANVNVNANTLSMIEHQFFANLLQVKPLQYLMIPNVKQIRIYNLASGDIQRKNSKDIKYQTIKVEAFKKPIQTNSLDNKFYILQQSTSSGNIIRIQPMVSIKNMTSYTFIIVDDSMIMNPFQESDVHFPNFKRITKKQRQKQEQKQKQQETTIKKLKEQIKTLQKNRQMKQEVLDEKKQRWDKSQQKTEDANATLLVNFVKNYKQDLRKKSDSIMINVNNGSNVNNNEVHRESNRKLDNEAIESMLRESYYQSNFKRGSRHKTSQRNSKDQIISKSEVRSKFREKSRGRLKRQSFDEEKDIGPMLLELNQGILYLQINDSIIKVQIIFTTEGLIKILLQESGMDYQLRMIVNQNDNQTNHFGYTINNELEDFVVTFTQQGIQDSLLRVLQPKQTKSFGLYHSTSTRAIPKILIFGFYFCLKNIDFETNFRINIDNRYLPIQHVHEINLNEKGESFRLVILVQKLKNSQIKFTIMTRHALQKMMEKLEKLNVKAKQISLQIQADTDNQLAFQICGLEVQRQKESTIVQRINVKLTNMLIRQNRNMPILKFIKPTSFFGGNSIRHMLSTYLILNKSSSGRIFKYVTLSLGDLQIHPRQKIVSLILNFASQIRRQGYKYKKDEGSATRSSLDVKNDGLLPSNIKHKSQSRYFSLELQEDQIDQEAHSPDLRIKFSLNSYPEMLSSSISKAEHELPYLLKMLKQRNMVQEKVKIGKKIMCIDQLQVYPSNFYLSYSKDQFSNYEQFKDDALLKYFMLVPAISQIKFSVPRIQMKQFKGQTKQLGKKMVKQMKGSISGAVLSSLNSISVLDNPFEFSDSVLKYITGLRQMTR